MKKKVLVIGSGIGGLSIACRLLYAGYDVSILEKNNSIGGKTNCLKYNDYKFDLTASITMLPSPYLELFKDLNRDYNDYFKLTLLNPIYKVFYSDGSSYDFSTNLPKLVSTLDKLDTDAGPDYMNFLAEVYRRYKIANKNFLSVPQFKVSNILLSIKKLTSISPLQNSEAFINEYIKNKKLKEFIQFQTMYIGISPFSGSSIYNIIPAMSNIYGLWHIQGGMYSYINALKKLILEMKGRIFTEKEVSQIIVNNNNATGVKLTDGTNLYSDIVVSDCDFSYTLKNLLSETNIKGKYNKNKLNELKYSCSTFILHLGLKKKYPNLTVHNIFINKNFKENIESIFKGELQQEPSLYIYVPSSIDNSFAPYGCDSMNVMVRVPNLKDSNINWDSEELITSLRNLLIDTVSSINGLKDIKNNIAYESYLTPLDLKNKFNCSYGCAFGILPSITQSNFFRPQFKLKDIDNLYFTGDSIHPGAGVSMVLKSSKIAANEIRRN